MAEPRCKVGDLVRVTKGPAINHFGTVKEAGDKFLTHVLGEAVWLVEFPAPVPCFNWAGAAQFALVHTQDSWLEPYRPSAEPRDMSVVQQLTNPLAQEVHS